MTIHQFGFVAVPTVARRGGTLHPSPVSVSENRTAALKSPSLSDFLHRHSRTLGSIIAGTSPSSRSEQRAI